LHTSVADPIKLFSSLTKNFILNYFGFQKNSVLSLFLKRKTYICGSSSKFPSSSIVQQVVVELADVVVDHSLVADNILK